MADLSSIANATTSINALSNLILVSPQNVTGYQPQNIPTQNGETNQALPSPILFHYEGENTATIESEITDHFVEDNTAIQDQIAIRPTIISVQGFIGELNDVAPIAVQALKAARDKLLAIAAYQPQLTETALIAYNQAFFAYQLASNLAQSLVQTASTITGIGGDNGAEAVINGNGIQNPNLGGSFGNFLNNQNQTKQQIVFQQFYAYQQQRRLFTIQTPWAIFQDMAIMTMRSIQGADTDKITDFELTFKQLRFAAADSQVLINSNNYSGRAAVLSAPETNTGQNPTSPTPKTLTQLVSNIA